MPIVNQKLKTNADAIWYQSIIDNHAIYDWSSKAPSQSS